MASLLQSRHYRSDDVEGALGSDPVGFPFRTELSLAPLLAFWSSEFGNVLSPKGRFGGIVREEAEKAPELFSPITDLSVIARYRQLVDMLMAAVLPPASFYPQFRT